MKLSEEARQPPVKFVQRLRVAVNIPAVAVEHVKVHKVHEAKSRKVLVRVGHCFLQPVGVSRRVGKLRHTAAGKNIVDLADGDHVLFRVHNRVQNRFLRRLDRKIVPSRRSHVRPFTGKGSGDDPSHAMLAHEKLSRNAAVFIELLGRDNILVRSNLEDGVCRRVDNQRTRFHLLAAIVPDDIRAGIGKIAQNFAAGQARKLVDNLLGKAVRVGRQRIFRDDTRDLPVADRGVLAH